jgi:hypothetical protein
MGRKGLRIAEIEIPPQEEGLFLKVMDLMLERGWDMRGSICGGGGDWLTAACPVTDRDEFREFMEDWKECKKEARA